MEETIQQTRKLCRFCNTEKDTCEFGITRNKKYYGDLYTRTKCKECERLTSRQRLQRYREAYDQISEHQCRSCLLTLPKDHFRPRDINQCRACRNIYETDWRTKNKRKITEMQRTYQRNRAVEKRAYIASFKNKPCVDCGIQYPSYVMEFDHTRGSKISVVSRMTNWTREKIHLEMAKCDLVCANCHRERTYKRRKIKKEEVTDANSATHS